MGNIDLSKVADAQRKRREAEKNAVEEAAQVNPVGKGIVIPKQKPKEQHGTLSDDFEERVQNVMDEMDEFNELIKKNPDDPRVKAFKANFEFTHGLRSTPGESIITATEKAKKMESLSNEEINKLGAQAAEALNPQEESSDLVKGHNVMKVSSPEDYQNIVKEVEEASGEKIDEVTVIVNKEDSEHLDFTEEERGKMLKSNIIRLKEVEEVELGTVTAKRVDSSKLDSILERRLSRNSVKVPIPISSYLATFRSLDVGEMADLLAPVGNNEVDRMISKWTTIYNAIETTSLGKMSFDEFCHNTCVLDYEMFLYGILLATYGDLELPPLPLDCGNKEAHNGEKYSFTRKYTYEELLSFDKMSDRLIQLFGETGECAATLEMAKACHERSPFLERRMYRMPNNGVIVAVQLESVYDSIHTHAQAAITAIEENRNNASFSEIVKNIPFMIIPGDTPEENVKVVDFGDKLKVLRHFDVSGINIITKKMGEQLDGLGDLYFGLANVECPGCHNVTEFVPVNIEERLFTMAAQMGTEIE